MAWWLKNMTEEKVEWLTGNLISQDCTTQDCSRGNRSIQQLESLKAGSPGFRFDFRRVGPPHARLRYLECSSPQ